MGYTKRIHDLMGISSFIVTKPGGLSSSEALSKSLPIIILKPLPGQESLNTQFLVEKGIALKAKDFEELRCLSEELLNSAGKLAQLRAHAAVFASPDSALKTARLILSMADEHKKHKINQN